MLRISANSKDPEVPKPQPSEGPAKVQKEPRRARQGSRKDPLVAMRLPKKLPETQLTKVKMDFWGIQTGRMISKNRR